MHLHRDETSVVPGFHRTTPGLAFNNNGIHWFVSKIQLGLFRIYVTNLEQMKSPADSPFFAATNCAYSTGFILIKKNNG
jgi:hypothetical protein